MGKWDADAESQGGYKREGREALNEETPRSRSVMLLSPGIVECLENFFDVAFGYCKALAAEECEIRRIKAGEYITYLLARSEPSNATMAAWAKTLGRMEWHMKINKNAPCWRLQRQ